MLAPKLDALARCLARIESKSPFTLERLRSDADLQDIISVNLERAIQMRGRREHGSGRRKRSRL